MIRYMTLGDVCTDLIDCPHESPDWKSEGVAVIRNFNLVNGLIDMQDGYYVDEDTYIRRTRRAVPSEGDIIFSREAPIGNCAIVPKDFKCCLGQRLVLLRVNHAICSSEYLLAVLQSSYVMQQIEQVSKRGSTVSNFAIGDLRELVVPVLDNQNEIAVFSKTVSEKIANNNAICSNLEAMAKLLYDYWFIQFDFPDENGKPYKSSGGKMVWNEELKREIPAGWEVKQIRELAKEGKDKSYNEQKSIPTLDLSVMPSGNMMLGKLNDSANFSTNLFEMKEGDIFFGSIRPYLKKAGIAPCDGAVAGTVHCFRPMNHDDYNFLAITLCNERMFSYATSASQGTKMPVVTLDALMDYKVAYDAITARQFNALDLQSIMSKCVMENQDLASLRDFLLPMLMNGQVKVGKADA